MTKLLQTVRWPLFSLCCNAICRIYVCTRSSLSSLSHLLSQSSGTPCQKNSCAPLASRLHIGLMTRRGAARIMHIKLSFCSSELLQRNCSAAKRACMGYPLPPQQICRTVPQQSLMSLSQCLSWRRAGLPAGAEHAVSSHSFPENSAQMRSLRLPLLSHVQAPFIFYLAL